MSGVLPVVPVPAGTGQELVLGVVLSVFAGRVALRVRCVSCGAGCPGAVDRAGCWVVPGMVPAGGVGCVKSLHPALPCLVSLRLASPLPRLVLRGPVLSCLGFGGCGGWLSAAVAGAFLRAVSRRVFAGAARTEPAPVLVVGCCRP